MVLITLNTVADVHPSSTQFLNARFEAAEARKWELGRAVRGSHKGRMGREVALVRSSGQTLFQPFYASTTFTNTHSTRFTGVPTPTAFPRATTYPLR